MLKQILPIISVLILASCGAQKQASPPAGLALEQEANGVIKKFKSELKFRLKKALKSEGLIKAINVCSTQAPDLAKKLSEETGWKVKRVSLKPRNRQTAIPDVWEEKVLKGFDKRAESGEFANQLTFAETVNGQFRFMKAQGVNALCLQCHGKSIDPAVEQALKKYYPEDEAKGYSPGQIRGAFSLIKKQ